MHAHCCPECSQCEQITWITWWTGMPKQTQYTDRTELCTHAYTLQSVRNINLIKKDLCLTFCKLQLPFSLVLKMFCTEATTNLLDLCTGFIVWIQTYSFTVDAQIVFLHQVSFEVIVWMKFVKLVAINSYSVAAALGSKFKHKSKEEMVCILSCCQAIPLNESTQRRIYLVY